jgi:hypothetical protein
MKEAYEASINAIPEQIIYTVIFTAALWWLCYKINNKKDL